jgi:hypothetical protein
VADFRRNAYRPSKISDNRARWVKVVNSEYVVYENKHDPERDEVGSNIILSIRSNRMKTPANINLTALTLEELRAIRELLTITLDRAEPICAERDKVADNAFQSGDDTNARSYRAAPFVVDRTRSIGEHGPGVRVRPAAVPDGTAGDDGGDDGSERSDVAQPAPPDVGAEDDGTTAD